VFPEAYQRSASLLEPGRWCWCGRLERDEESVRIWRPGHAIDGGRALARELSIHIRNRRTTS
jgi:hypothetical protein